MASSATASGVSVPTVDNDRHVATLLAVERLALVGEQPTKFSKWYEAGKDFG